MKHRRDRQIMPHRPEISINAEFEKGDKYILLDVGGGTCDAACHEIVDQFAIAEVLHPSGNSYVVSVVLLIKKQCITVGYEW